MFEVLPYSYLTQSRKKCLLRRIATKTSIGNSFELLSLDNIFKNKKIFFLNKKEYQQAPFFTSNHYNLDYIV